jgi:cytoskeletal protein CcmA (bactofilin family)
MWGSKRNERTSFDDLLEDRDGADVNREPAPEPRVAPPAAPQARVEEKPVSQPKAAQPTGSVLGRTLIFRGDLTADEDLVLQGRVEGSISHKGNLTIGEDGVTHGNVSARQIIVEGSVEGDLIAEAFVSVRASGCVDGSIVSPRLALADGARFNGSIDMQVAQATGRSEKTQRKGNETTRETGVTKASGTTG